jgi:hypothetical protein
MYHERLIEKEIERKLAISGAVLIAGPKFCGKTTTCMHEVWAQSRISQGWTYGKERSDALKQHPCLVPYEELPEVEKAYDRDTALGTLKLISKLGFKISKE